MRTRGNATICTALLMIVAFGAACTNEHDASTATVVVTDVRASSCDTRVREGMLKSAVQVGDKASTIL